MSNNDLISRSEAEKLGATCLARRNENGQLEAIISLDNVPTVEPEKVLVANFTFDADKLKEIVQTEVIDKIKNGELVIQEEERKVRILPMKTEIKIILNDIEQNILNKIWDLPKYERSELYKVLTDWCLNGLLMEADEMAHNDTLK